MDLVHSTMGDRTVAYRERKRFASGEFDAATPNSVVASGRKIELALRTITGRLLPNWPET